MLWQEQQRDALAELCDRITSPPMVRYPDYNYPFVLQTDASHNGQKQNGKMRVMGYWFRPLSPAEKKYHSGKLEFVALKWAVCEHFRDHLYYAPPFTVCTDNNPLTYALTTTRLNATCHRWVAKLSEFNFHIKYRPRHLNRDADALSRIQVNFSTYIDSCTNNITLDKIKADINEISAQATIDVIWISAVTTGGERQRFLGR